MIPRKPGNRILDIGARRELEDIRRLIPNLDQKRWSSIEFSKSGVRIYVNDSGQLVFADKDSPGSYTLKQLAQDTIDGGGGGGEANTASNIGAGGIGFYKQKVGVDLQFKNAKSDAATITITDDAVNNEVNFEVAGGGGPAFPIGSVFLAVVATDPSVLLGYGTWTQIAQGKFLVGQDGTDTDFDVAEETGGAKTHTHAQHTAGGAHTHDSHTFTANKLGGLAGSPVTGPTTHSSDGSHQHNIHDTPSHLPPYLVVYAWKRTA